MTDHIIEAANPEQPVQRLPEDLVRLLDAIEGKQWSPQTWAELQAFLFSNASHFLNLWIAARKLREALEFEVREYGLEFGPEQTDYYRDFLSALLRLEVEPSASGENRLSPIATETAIFTGPVHKQ